MPLRLQSVRRWPVLMRYLALALLLHLTLFGTLMGIGAWTASGRVALAEPHYVLAELIAAPSPPAAQAAPVVTEMPEPAQPEPPAAAAAPVEMLAPQRRASAAQAAGPQQPEPGAGFLALDRAAAGDAQTTHEAQPAAAVAGADDDIRERWESRLLEHLDRHKRYPPRAQWLGQEGVVQIEVRTNRGGQVLAHRLVGGSGHRLLDAEALDLIARADPLPPPPPDVADRDLEFRVPIEFFIERRVARFW